MPTPTPPSAIWGALLAGGSLFAVDPPIVQDAQFRANQTYFSYLDSQIRGLETHVVQSLVSGRNATWVRVDNSSAAIVAGNVVCLAGSTAGTVTLATSTPLGAAGIAFGIALQAAPPGGLLPVAIKGLIPPSISGLPTVGNSPYARVNASNGTIQTVSSLGSTDFAIGTVDAAGNITLSIQLPSTTSGGGGGALTQFGADLQNSTALNQWVAAISGNGGTGVVVPVHTVGFQFDAAQTTPTISQLAQTSNAASNNLVLAPQGPFSNAWAPGSFVVSLASPAVGSTSHGGFILQEGGTPFFRVDNGTGHGGPSDFLVAFWFGAPAASPTSTNWGFAWDPGASQMIYTAPFTTAGTYAATSSGDLTILTGTTATTGITIGALSNTTGPQYVIIGADLTSGVAFTLGAVALPGNRHVSILNATASGNVTATQIPSGDRVTYVADTSTPPASSPVNGALLYSSGGALFVWQSNGTHFQIGTGGGGGVTWTNDLINSTSSVQYVSGLSSSATGGAVTLASNAWISVSNNTTIVKQGTQVVMNLSSGILELGGVAAGVYLLDSGIPVAQFNASSTDFVALGSSPAQSGQVRLANNTGFIAARNAAGSLDIDLLSTDTNNNVTVGGSNGKGVLLFAGSTNVARLQALSASDFIAFGASPATAGDIRASNNTTVVASLNSFGTLNIALVSTDSSNNMIIGSTNGNSLFLKDANGTSAQLGGLTTDFLALGLAAGTGYLRLPNSLSMIKALSHSGLTDIFVFGMSTSDDIAIGTQGQTGKIQLNQIIDYEANSSTSSSATAGSATISGGTAPVGFMILTISGTSRKVPYYAT